MECLAAKYGSCRTTNCKNPGPHMICFEGSDEATESAAPSGQAEFDLLTDCLAECKERLQDMVDATYGQATVTGKESIRVKMARKRGKEFLAK